MEWLHLHAKEDHSVVLTLDGVGGRGGEWQGTVWGIRVRAERAFGRLLKKNMVLAQTGR